LRQKPKVTKFGIEAVIQHHITWLNIPMQEAFLTFTMEVYKTRGYSS
jgi:hypothetical protein